MDLNQINQTAIESLLGLFDKVFTDNNVLILDRNLSSLINYLIPFKQFKLRAKFDKIVWIDDDSIKQLPPQNFIVVTETTDFELPDHGKITVIVKNLTKLKLFLLNKKFNLNLTFKHIIESLLVSVRSNQLRVLNWQFEGLEVDKDVLSLQELHCIDNYLNNPLLSINNLNECLINLIKRYNIKINNIYCQGVNSNLLLKLYHKSLHEYLAGNFNNLQQEFYLNHLKGDYNLIILERNMDFLPIVMNQVNYIGLLNDLLDYQINIVKVPNDKEHNGGTKSVKFTDELFDKLKYLNFSLIGNKLNQLARLIKDQYNSNTEINLQEMKHLVENLTDLNHQQELIKKHTQICELLLDNIKVHGDKKYNEYEIFLNFCNEVFQLSYKQQVAQVNEFLMQNLSEKIILNCLVLISIINSNIKERDYDSIKTQCFQTYGISVIYKLDKLISLNLINVNEWDPSPNSSIQEGITGGLNVYKNNYTLLNKFWNLHPEEGYDESARIDTYNHSLPSNTIPLTVRVIESLFLREFLTYKPINKITKLPSWENLNLDKMFKGTTTEIVNDKQNVKKNTILMFLGGITWSEVSCIKVLNEVLQKRGLNKQFIIMTNNIINNNDLIDTLT